MKLNEKDLVVLAAVNFKADAPLTEIAKTTGLRVHTIRHSLDKLLAQKVLIPFPFINVYALGYTVYSIFISISPQGATSRKKIVEYLVKDSRTSWVAELGGDYTLVTSVVVRSVVELSRFNEELSARFPGILAERAVLPHVAGTIYQPKYVSADIDRTLVVPWGETKGMPQLSLDELDKKILSATVHNPASSRRELSRVLGLPFSTVDYRLKKLKENGVLSHFIYLTNPSAFGMMNFKLLVSTTGVTAAFREKFEAVCQEHPLITTLVHTAGDWDFELNVEPHNSTMISEVVDSLHQKFSTTLRKIQILSILNELKFAAYPFLDEASPECALEERRTSRPSLAQ